MEAEKFKHTRRMILSRVLLVPFIIVMLVCGTLVYYFAANLSEHVSRELANTADGHRRLIEQFLKERAFDLELIADSRKIGAINHNDLVVILEQLQKGSPAFFDLGIFDEQGNHVAYVGPYNLQGKNYARTEWFKNAQNNKIYISDVFLGYRNIPHFVIVMRKKEGEHNWFLRATIDTLYFYDLVGNIRLGKTGEAYLVNKIGVLQTQRHSGGKPLEADSDFNFYKSDESAIMSFKSGSNTGSQYLYATGRLHEPEWLLVVRQDRNDAYAPLAYAVLFAVALIVGGGAIVMTMGFWLASSLAHRLSMAEVEKRQMGTQLIMAGKLAEVGEMSAGVAHEINNPLQIMKSEYSMIKDLLEDFESGKHPPDSKTFQLIEDSIEQMGIQIDRCKKITQGLLKFARKSETAMRVVDLRPFIQEVVGMIEHRAQLENIRVSTSFDDNLPELKTDPTQLQQALINLLNNALDALKGKEHGEVKIKISHESGYIIISVADNGCGIAPENLGKIFLPFFTTKPVGKGTGLGLSTSYGIIEDLGGQITVNSKLNEGTVFTVRLPLADAAQRVAGG